jgi:hypothetical protein
MKLLSCVLAVAFTAMGMIGSAKADLVFRIAQTTPPAGDITVGLANAATFSIFVRSTVANQTLIGTDFTLSLSSGTGAGGRLVAGTNDLVLPAPGGWVPDFFAPLGEGTAVPFSAVITLGNPAVTIQTTESLLATARLSTVGATEGTYVATISDILLADGSFNDIPVDVTNSTLSVNYTITAIPEPSSMALAGIALAGIGYRIRRRRSKSVDPS